MAYLSTLLSIAHAPSVSIPSPPSHSSTFAFQFMCASSSGGLFSGIYVDKNVGQAFVAGAAYFLISEGDESLYKPQHESEYRSSTVFLTANVTKHDFCCSNNTILEKCCIHKTVQGFLSLRTHTIVLRFVLGLDNYRCK